MSWLYKWIKLKLGMNLKKLYIYMYTYIWKNRQFLTNHHAQWTKCHRVLARSHWLSASAAQTHILSEAVALTRGRAQNQKCHIIPEQRNGWGKNTLSLFSKSVSVGHLAIAIIALGCNSFVMTNNLFSAILIFSLGCWLVDMMHIFALI